MHAQVIGKDRIIPLLDELFERYRVIAPICQDDLVLFGEITSGDRALLEFSNTRLSVKEAFFPRTETMFLFDGNRLEEPTGLQQWGGRERQVILGVRPCDAAGLPVLDAVFGDGSDCPDVYYAGRRARSIVVGLACDRPTDTCFCRWVGGGPFSTRGMDVLLTDLGDRYLAQAHSVSGEQFLETAMSLPGGAFFGAATAEDLEEKARLARQAEGRIRPGPDVGALSQRLAEAYEEPFWDALHQKCLGCGVCTYVCPTCHCFDILEESDGHRGRRVRVWDSCQYALFTYHASGHNPRPGGRERMRQRVMHKFRYFVENHGEPGCVGCGRCIRQCPVNMDIRRVLGDIVALPRQEAGRGT
jgi:formate hydrogenlyase subunit 6/NADH:ubiquinone oxidoreductase subunit I